jgi:two-component system, LuxR family, sensor histidine kinase DctS
MLRGRRLAFTEPDGTRLALHGSILEQRRLQRASSLLDLPGHTLMLRLEGPRIVGSGFFGLFPNLLTAVVGALSLALLAVLACWGATCARRQRAEHELADALAFRKAMENSLVTGLRARDMQGHITYVNPAFCQMVGYSAEELVGTGCPAPWWPPDWSTNTSSARRCAWPGRRCRAKATNRCSSAATAPAFRCSSSRPR